MSTGSLANRWARTLVVLFLFCSVAIPALKVSAQTSTGEQGSGSSIRVSPPRTDVRIRPGESRTVPVYVENLESKPVTLKPIENDFIAGDDESGAPAIILDEDEYAPTHSLKRFMQPLDAITLQPGERKQVDVVINVPSDAQAGGYFGALRFAPANADGSEIVNVSGSVASLILLTVPGNLVESLKLTNFDILAEGEPMGRYLSSPEKVSVVIRFENKGNVQVSPFGKFIILKGDEVVYSANVNDTKPAGVVLPDSARKFEIPAEKLGNFGQYTFKATLGYGTGGETFDVERTAWIIPSIYIVGAIVALLAIIALITFIVLALKSYKRKILRSARRR